jgi:hypothetical protein
MVSYRLQAKGSGHATDALQWFSAGLHDDPVTQ